MTEIYHYCFVVAVLVVMTFLEVRCPHTISDVDHGDHGDLSPLRRGGGASHDLLRGKVPMHDLRCRSITLLPRGGGVEPRPVQLRSFSTGPLSCY